MPSRSRSSTSDAVEDPQLLSHGVEEEEEEVCGDNGDGDGVW